MTRLGQKKCQDVFKTKILKTWTCIKSFVDDNMEITYFISIYLFYRFDSIWRNGDYDAIKGIICPLYGDLNLYDSCRHCRHSTNIINYNIELII